MGRAGTMSPWFLKRTARVAIHGSRGRIRN
nr:MAG TPA: hypothetical protein [Caudoviricetes sp.]